MEGAWMADKSDPAYARVVAAIRQKIVDEHWDLGTALPSIEKIRADYDVSANVARRVLFELRAQGVAEVKPGSGSYLIAMPSGENASTSPEYREITRRLDSIQQQLEDLAEQVAEMKHQRPRASR